MSMTVPSGRRILNWLALLILLLIVVPFVIYAVPGVIGAEASFVVLSGSMEPSISTGDVVIVDETTPEALREGDVITYLRSDAETPTTHRIVGITEQDGERAFVTQGDNNDQPDQSPVPASQVMGVVILTIPYIGYVIEFANTTAGFVALIVVPFLLLLAIEIRSILTGGSSGASSNQSASEDGDLTATDADDEPAVSVEADPDGETSDGGIALTATDLRLSLGILMGSTIYAGWVVYNIQTAWAFAVVFASAIGALLVGSMYYMAGSGETDGEGNSRGDSADTSTETRSMDGGYGYMRDPLYLPTRQSRRDDNGTAESDGGPGADSIEPSIAPGETTEAASPNKPESRPALDATSSKEGVDRDEMEPLGPSSETFPDTESGGHSSLSKGSEPNRSKRSEDTR